MGKYSDSLLGVAAEPMQSRPRRYSDELLGGGQPATPSSAPQQKEEGWGEWIVNSVRGRQDPSYSDAANAPRVGEQFRGDLQGVMGGAALLGASDAQLGDVVQSNLGDKFIRREKDANGYDVFVTRGTDGKEQRAYLNKPGLDTQDVARAIFGAAPYVLGGGLVGAATKGAGVGIQAVAQGAGAIGTSVAGDIAQIPLGSEQGVELEKAAVVGGAGAAGPLASAAGGALWRRFVTIPGLVDEAGNLTPNGMAAAKQAGIDPADLTPEFGKKFASALAQSEDPAIAATQAGAESFGIPATRGQITKDPYLLTQEEAMRRRLYGERAQDVMRGFDAEQQAALKDAALGGEWGSSARQSPSQSIAKQLNPDRAPGFIEGDRTPSVLGGNVQNTLRSARETARQQESALWDDNVRDLGASPYALATLRGKVETALSESGVTDFTPTIEKMAKVVGEFADGNLPQIEAGGIKLKQTWSVDSMRRRLGAMVGAAEDGTDKRNAGVIYDAFNDWIGDAAEKNLLIGSPETALQLVKARGFTREVRELFAPSAGGRPTPAGQRLEKIIDGRADSGESVIAALLGPQGGKSTTAGTVRALKSVKSVLDKFSDSDAGSQAWNDIRLAYWTRLVLNKNGEMAGAQQISSSIKSALQNQRSALQTLYSPKEIGEIRKFLRAVDAVAYKPPNASGSGYTAASLLKDGLLKIVDAFGLGTPARAAVNMSGIDRALGAAQAQRAVRASIRPKRPNISPVVNAAGATYGRNRD